MDGAGEGEAERLQWETERGERKRPQREEIEKEKDRSQREEDKEKQHRSERSKSKIEENVAGTPVSRPLNCMGRRVKITNIFLTDSDDEAIVDFVKDQNE